MNEVNKNKNEFCFSSKNKILVENELKNTPKVEKLQQLFRYCGLLKSKMVVGYRQK